MKTTKIAMAIILGVTMFAGLACGGSGAAPTPTPTAEPMTTPTVQPPTPATAIVNDQETNSGSQINLSVGDQLSVTLDSNATTGYSWNLSAISDASVIAKISDEYIAPTPSDPPLAGQGGQEVWTFEALDAGTATISMQYIRPWETEPEPAKTFEITVTVE